VNAWLWAATALLAGVVPCGVVAVRAPLVDALVALEAAGVVVTLALLLLAEGFARSVYFDVSLVLAVTSFAGTLAFARMLGRWL
jgi:multicomponent Na+:H+ antiporter subunit F